MICFVMLFFATLQYSFSQERVITGVVKDQSGVELPGVTVMIKGEQKGTSTDFDGSFKVRASQGTILVFSYIGMKTKEVKVGSSTTIKVVLEDEVQAIDEVVVVAYGTAKKESLVGAQSMISSKQLETRPITNLTSALSGAASGLQVTLSGGQPGTSSEIRIRGFGSINAGSDPIYVVDGSIYNGKISDIATQDIENISVLKDAASTSLYGSSAGNGVVLITTKSGLKSKKGKPTLTYNNSIGFSRRGQEDYDKVDAMDFYPLRWQQWFNDYKYNRGMTDDQAAGAASKDVYDALIYQPYAGIKSVYAYSGGTWSLTDNPAAGAETFPAIVMPDGKLNPEITGLLWGDDLDWEKHLFRTGIRNEHNVSISQNTDKTKSYFSVGYIKEQGYRIRTDYERFSGRANLSYDVNNWLTVGTNISYSKTKDEAPRTTTTSVSNTFGFIRGIAPIYPIHAHNLDGTYVLDEEGNRVYDYAKVRPYNGNYNPIYEAQLDAKISDDDGLVTRNFAEFRFLPELKLKLNYSYDMLRYTTKQRYNKVLGAQSGNGLLEILNLKRQTTNFNQLLEYNKEFNNHSLNVLLGHESYRYYTYNSSAQKKKESFLGVDEFSNYGEVNRTSSVTDEYTKEGYFGRINYGFDRKYDASFSFRRDGSSRFHNDYRWGNFWSLGLGWHLKNEKFLHDVSWLNSLKLRASYGETGNDATTRDENPSYYPYQTTYSYVYNNDLPGLRVANYADYRLLWEKQVSYDLGLEFGFFSRLRGTVELFNKESKDLIFEFPLPTSTGVSGVDRNVGKVRNYGVEFELNYDVLKRGNFRWSLTANGTILKNKVVTLPEHNREKGINHGSYFNYREGRSMYEFFIVDWIGVNPNTGLAMYRLDNETYPQYADPTNKDFKGVEKDGELAAYTYDYEVAKKHFAGTSIPDLYGGFGTTIEWNNFDFGAQFTYQLGGLAYDAAYASSMGRGIGQSAGRAMHVDMLNAWKKPGDITDVPRLDVGTLSRFDASISDRFLISRTALMLKNVSLGYTLPKDVVSKYGIENLRVGISGENLFLWSKRKGFNPMSNFSGTTSNFGYDYAKVVTCNLTVSF